MLWKRVAQSRQQRAQARSLRLPTSSTMSALEEELISRAPSQHGRRWRSLVCAVTRNEWHLREWLLRTLYVGVSHIVLVDDNHAGLDRDISALLRPLIAIGLVTHAPSVHCGDRCVAQKSWVQPLALQHRPLALAPHLATPNAQCDIAGRRARKDAGMRARVRQSHGLAATDRYRRTHLRGARRRDAQRSQPGARAPRTRGWSRRTGAVVNDVRRAADSGGADPIRRRPHAGIPSRALCRAGTHRNTRRLHRPIQSSPSYYELSLSLKPNPKPDPNQMTKPIGMPAHVTFRPPHRFNGCVQGRGRCSWRAARACRDGICTVGGGRGRLALLHYFQKTVQSFLLKRDISLPHQRQTDSRALRAAGGEPSGIRSLCSMYDNGRFGQAHDCRSLRTFPFAPSYLRGVARLLEATNGWGDAGRTRWIPPHRAGAPDTQAVHDMFRRTIAAGLAFSPKLYAQAVPYDRARYCDELQHLLHSRCSRAAATQRSAVVGTSGEWMVPVVSSVSGSVWRQHNSTVSGREIALIQS